MKHHLVLIVFAALLVLTVLDSCLGISAEITLGRNGSGTIRLEYRLAGELESLGKLDGNEGRPSIPVGRTDFERTAARIPGLTLKSFSSAAEGNDAVYRAALAFTDTDALLRFLDASGQKASLSQENGRNRLSLTLADGGGAVESGLGELVSSVSRGYFLTLSFSLPSETEITLTDETGRPIDPPQGWNLAGGRRPSFSAPIGEVLLFERPLHLETVWGF
ncbi:MAG: hypothetical protein LBH70_03230 [Spirochaetaceae bacterium]|jgi:hypothetical protein|nr:hypothetical protein [Spirochaetaceae bacterium]